MLTGATSEIDIMWTEATLRKITVGGWQLEVKGGWHGYGFQVQ
jgi:hypothetical protein